MSEIQFELNGETRRTEVREGEKFLETLRTRCGVISPKDGCQPQGQCGCCLALIDGNPKVSCAVPAGLADGSEVLTLEGLSEEERNQTARAFVAAAGLQCGFCIPGLALRAKWLLERNPDPTRSEIARAIDGHLCRCTGYVRVLDAIELLAEARRTGEEIELVTDGGVGDPLSRYQGVDLALGDRPYTDDLAFEGMLHGAVVLSEHARAKVLSIDTSRAEAVDGVWRVATAADVPGDRWYGLIEKDWPGLVAEGEEVRCVGDFLAVVVADDEATAREAADLVEVSYEVMEPVVDPVEAMADDAPRVNPTNPNVLSHTLFGRGEPDRVLAESAHVVEGTWQTQRIEHLYLEPESAVARPRPDGKLHLYSQGQGIFDDRSQVASFLGIPEEQIHAELVPNGGAFGGKEDMSIQPHAALAATLTGRPVKVALDREESIRIHPKRHPIRMEYEVGCDDDGHITAVKAKMIGDTGAYASVGAKVLERAAGHAHGPYKVPHCHIESWAVHTNNPPGGAMRGFGVNQAAFGIEGALDDLAAEAGLDPWEFRYRNAVEEGDLFSSGQVLEKAVGLRETLEAVKDDFYEAWNAGTPVGIASGMKNTGIGNGAEEWGKCRLVVEDPETVSVHIGYTEMGQGLLTVAVQFAAEETGLPASVFEPRVNSTYALGCGQTTGSRATFFTGKAIQRAAAGLREAIEGGATLADLVGEIYAGDVLVDDTTSPKDDVETIKTHTSFGYATQMVTLDEEGRLEKVLAAHDVGKAVNPDLCKGQIEGSIHMGLGFGLTEELPCEDGMPVTFKLREIGVLRASDMPEVEVRLVEVPEPEGPYGVKGVGEIGLVPTAAAVAGALARHDGVRRKTLPMKDSPAAEAIRVGRIRAERKDSWR